VLFIAPAMLCVLAIAWAYVTFGTAPQLGWLLYGLKPAVLAVVAQALWSLARPATRTVPLGVVASAVLALSVAGVNELPLLAGGGVLMVALRHGARLPGAALALAPPLVLPGLALPAVAGSSLVTLFLTFLKIGSVLYGSGYVLLAFLRGDFVERLGWLTDQQLLDAVAIGQFTPGPVFTTATFVGYLVAEVPGALLATVAIFLPSFVFVALLSRILPWVRRTPWARTGLDGVNAAALGLMAAVTLQLAGAALVDGFTMAAALASWAVLAGAKLNSAWVVGAAGLAGIAVRAAFG
jgi:chromate transporter